MAQNQHFEKLAQQVFIRMSTKDAFSRQFSQFSAEANDFGAKTLLFFVKFGEISPSSKTLGNTADEYVYE